MIIHQSFHFQILPNSQILDLFVVQVQHESLHLDTDLIMKPLISQINSPSEINSLSFSRYIKGKAKKYIIIRIYKSVNVTVE